MGAEYEFLTGLIYINEEKPDFLSLLNMTGDPLATLPQELGTTPGFIFLDEPLSAFDYPRTEALVDLLTTGQIARNFQQIFLISHSRSFDSNTYVRTTSSST